MRAPDGLGEEFRGAHGGTPLHVSVDGVKILWQCEVLIWQQSTELPTKTC